MNAAEVVDQFRMEVNDVDLPPLWSDTEAYAYLNDAQVMFCRLTGGLADASTVEVTRLPVVVNRSSVPLSDKILKVRHAFRVSDGLPLTVANYEDLLTLGLRLDGRTGPVAYVIIGMDKGKALLYPKPSVVDAVQLIVDRLPLANITEDDSEAEFEIDEQHHEHLTVWMRHRAYSKQDAQTYDKTKSATFKSEFMMYCAAAKSEKDRAKHKTRIVAYGGL